MSPTQTDAIALLDQRLQALEKKQQDDIRDIRNAHEQARRDASLALAAFVTVKVYELGIDNVKLFINTLIKDVEGDALTQQQQLDILRRDFDSYKTQQESDRAAQSQQKQSSASHRWMVASVIVGAITGIVGMILGILSFVITHFSFH